MNKKASNSPSFKSSKAAGNVLVIIVTVIITAVVIIGGWFVYDWWQSSEQKEEVVQPTNNTNTIVNTNISINTNTATTTTKTENELLKVTAPIPNQEIKSPVKVSGQSNFFEASTRIRIKDDNEEILVDTETLAEGWMDKLYPFAKDVYYKKPTAPQGTVEVFENSAKDGSEINKISIPVTFADYLSAADSWPLTDFMGAYLFAYPNGWHVTNFWPESLEAPISILLDPEPVNTAPRGGPASTIVINDWSGFDNPEEIFNQKLEEEKSYLQDLEVETTTAAFGTIYHLKGTMEFFGEFLPTESYLFMIQGSTPDEINRHIINASLETSIEKSEILKKIVSSFEEL